MHLKQAYQRRKQQESNSHRKSNNSVDHSTTIGSVHTGHVNYANDQPFFLDFKLRESVKQARQFVKSFKDKDIMELKPKQWNASVSAPTKFDDFEKEESQQSKLLKIKLGFSDFTPIKEKPNKIYPGTETRDNFRDWNVSTFFDQKQKTKALDFTNINAIDNTIKFNSTKLNNYKSLKQRYNETNVLNRSEIINNSDIIEDLKQSFIFTYPNSSPEKAHASALKMFDQIRRQKLKREMKEDNETEDSWRGSRFRASLSPTQAMKIKYVHFHTGCWQKRPGKDQQDSEDEQDGYYWTCCLNESRDGKGCSYRIEDGNKMNLSSFNHV